MENNYTIKENVMNNQPLEIERKYLIKMPECSVLSLQPGYFRTEMTQIYIATPDGFDGRIRKSACEDGTVYTKTYKRDITDIKRIEIEQEISAQEYQRLTSYILENTKPIVKVRHSFEHDNKLLEIDIYEFWDDRATLEIELTSEDEQVSLPDFIELIKEITCDKRYRNFALARAVPEEEI